MGFLWRRRSSLVKIVVLLSAVWFTIAFLIYSEDRRSSGQSNNMPLALIKDDEFDDFRGNNKDINRIDSNVFDKEIEIFGAETSKANIDKPISSIKKNRPIAGGDDGKLFFLYFLLRVKM